MRPWKPRMIETRSNCRTAYGGITPREDPRRGFLTKTHARFKEGPT